MKPDNGYYEGSIRNGKPEGKGRFTFPDGSTYEGDFRNGQMQGEGVYRGPDGAVVYDGGFKNGVYEGNAVYYFETGAFFRGSFKDGKYHGKDCCYTYPDRSVMFEGEYRNGTWYYGTLYYKNGDSCEGYFKDGKPHGRGIYRRADGSTQFDGDYINGALSYGTFYYRNGDVYEGSFKDGKLHGRGVYRHADGRVVRGEWTEGTYSGSGESADAVQPAAAVAARQKSGSPFRVCFMDHCAFVIEAPSATLIFDCHIADKLPPLDPDKPVIVFISHQHVDHFDPGIIKLDKQYPEVEYYIGNSSDEEIKMLVDRFEVRNIHRVRGGMDIATDWGSVTTVHSTDWGVKKDNRDRGVAFVVRVNGKNFLHTGDLVFRKPRYRGENGEIVEFEDIKDEELAEYAVEESRKLFYKYVRPIKNYHINYAMIAMDSRSEFGIRTAKAYLDEVEIDYYTPMHQWGNYGYTEKFLEQFPWCADKMIFMHTSMEIFREIKPMEFADLPFGR